MHALADQALRRRKPASTHGMTRSQVADEADDE
jgi:hypothetical protein